MPSNKPNPERNDRIFREIQGGMSHKAACAKYRLSHGRLNKIICAHPEYVSKRAGSSERNVEIAQLCAEGVPQQDIAKRFGVSRNVVSAAYSRWIAKNQPDHAKPKPRPRASQPIPLTREQIEADRKMIAEFIATKGVKICPAVALVPTQATLKHNPGIDDRWNGSTGWPASDQARRAKRGARVIAMRSLACV